MKNIVLELTRITQEAALAQDHKTQVQLIVDAIHDVLNVDVCSLYLENSSGDMTLMASHGLSTHHPIIIPSNKGLVGLVARYRHAINIVEPAKHPDYYHVPQAQEDEFQSYCGVPLVCKGKVIGVLVIQSRKTELVTDEQEAFLSTLASHLALLVPSLPIRESQKAKFNSRITGLTSSSGVAIGRVKLNQSACLMDVVDSTSQDKTKELNQWQTLKTLSIAALQCERDRIEETLGESLASIFDAYKMLLNDHTFDNKVIDEINNGMSVMSALKHAVRFFSETFRNMDDPYLKARHEDIDQLGDKLYQQWLDEKDNTQDTPLQAETVLVGESISVSDILSLPTEKLVGIVCFSGSALSHISVFANALGIPAVMGVGSVGNLIDNEEIIIDGDAGVIIKNPSLAVIAEYQQLISNRLDFDRELTQLCDLPATTTDGIRIHLMANSGLQADLIPGVHSGAEGIGLYRTEIPFMARQSLPNEEEQIAFYKETFNVYPDKPVYVRTLDVGGDKALPYLPIIAEENPALGWRGVRFSLDNLQLLITQLRAIIRASQGRDDIQILMPMISSTSELDQCIQILDDVCVQLTQEGTNFSRPKIGVMIEVPAAVALLPFWRNKIDFICIGSNDLSQYLLAMDRNNHLVGKLYDPLHPGVIHELHRIIKTASEFNIPICLCGEMAADPVSVILLIGLGIRRFSMSASKLPWTKWIIRSISIRDAEFFSQQALTLDNAAAIRRIGLEVLSGLGLDLKEFKNNGKITLL